MQSFDANRLSDALIESLFQPVPLIFGACLPNGRVFKHQGRDEALKTHASRVGVTRQTLFRIIGEAVEKLDPVDEALLLHGPEKGVLNVAVELLVGFPSLHPVIRDQILYKDTLVALCLWASMPSAVLTPPSPVPGTNESAELAVARAQAIEFTRDGRDLQMSHTMTHAFLKAVDKQHQQLEYDVLTGVVFPGSAVDNMREGISRLNQHWYNMAAFHPETAVRLILLSFAITAPDELRKLGEKKRQGEFQRVAYLLFAWDKWIASVPSFAIVPGSCRDVLQRCSWLFQTFAFHLTEFKADVDTWLVQGADQARQGSLPNFATRKNKDGN